MSKKSLAILIFVLVPLIPSLVYCNSLLDAAVEQQWQEVLTLVKAGHSIKQVDNQGHTLLMIGAMQNDPVVFKKLIELGSDVNQKDNTGHTALDYAVKNKRYQQVFYLIKAGALLENQDDYKQNYITMALQGNDTNTALVLLGLGARPHEQDEDKISQLLIKAIDRSLPVIALNMMKVKLNFNVRDKSSQTALMAAAKKGYLKLVEQLLKVGAAVDEKDLSNRTALNYAIQATLLKKHDDADDVFKLKDPLSDLFKDDVKQKIPVNHKAVIKALRHAGAKADRKIINQLLEHEDQNQGIWHYYIRSQLYYWEITLFYLGTILTMVLLFRQFDIWIDIIAVFLSVSIACIATLGLAGNHIPELQYILSTTNLGKLLFGFLRTLVISAFALSLIYLLWQLLETSTDKYECQMVENELSCENCGKTITLETRKKGFCPYCKKRFDDPMQL